MLKRSAIAGVLAAFGLVAFATNAEAATLKDLFAYGPSPLGFTNELTDDSVEIIIQNDGQDPDDPDSTLDVGDSLRGIVRFTQLFRPGTDPFLDPVFGNPEVTALFQTRVRSKTFVGTDPGTGLDQFIFAFEPDPAFAEATALGLTGAMVLVYEDAAADFTNDSGSVAGDIANVTDGTFFWAMGMNGTFGAGDVTDLGESWQTDDTFDQASLSFLVGRFSVSLNRVLGGSGAGDGVRLGVLPSSFDITKFVQFVGSGEFQANSGIAGDYWPVTDEADFTFQVIVPLPAAAWAGFAMLGLIGVGRKLRRRSA